MDYGELLDDYEPEHENIYSYFVKYFNNPTMTKVKDTENTNHQKFSIDKNWKFVNVISMIADVLII